MKIGPFSQRPVSHLLDLQWSSLQDPVPRYIGESNRILVGRRQPSYLNKCLKYIMVCKLARDADQHFKRYRGSGVFYMIRNRDHILHDQKSLDWSAHGLKVSHACDHGPLSGLQALPYAQVTNHQGRLRPISLGIALTCVIFIDQRDQVLFSKVLDYPFEKAGAGHE